MKRLLCAAAVALALGVAPATWAETKLYSAADLLGGELSGSAVAISGTTAVVGAPAEDGNIGAVYVFVNDGGWALQQRLAPSDAAAGANFGASVSIHGDDIAVGAPGRNGGQGGVYTFTRSGTTWTEDAAVIVPANSTADFGRSVSIETTTLAIGAPKEDVATKAAEGVTYVYVKPAATWVLQQRIREQKGNARAGDHIGSSVSLSGNTILSGAPDDDQNKKRADKGSIWVYVRNGTVWSKQTQFKPASQALERAGASVALFSNRAVVGAPGKSNGQGAAYTFTRSGTTWSNASAITAAGAANGDRFGTSVAVSGPLKLIGAPQAAGTGSGKTYLFGSTNNSLGQLTASDNTAGDNFGTSVSIDSGSALVGAPGQDPDAKSDAGAAYVFDGLVTATTTEITSITPEPSNAGQAYTVSVKVTPAPTVAPRIVDVNDGDGAVCTPSITLDSGGLGSCQLTSIAPGPHTISAAFNGNDLFSASQDTESHSVVGGDLAVSKDDNTDKVVAGEVKVYNIVVSNPGDFPATGVALTDTLPAELTNASWVCTPSGVGAVCPVPANGTGNIVAQLVDLLPGTSVTFALTATVIDPLPGTTTFIDNTASINVGANADLNTNNNTATDTDDVAEDGIFEDGFEDPPI